MNFLQTTLNSVNDIFDLDRNFALAPFIFRGQSDERWSLDTSIERAVSHFRRFGNSFSDYRTDEKWMLHEFKRKKHLFSHIPECSGDVDMLAIMQHYGAPTRLLDFTDSILIALYFAIMQSTSDSAIWCINKWRTRDRIRDKFGLDYKFGEVLKDTINNHHLTLANSILAAEFRKNETLTSAVVPIEPTLLTERSSRQQGLFLMPTNPNVPFMQNLISTFDEPFTNFSTIPISELIEGVSQHLNKDNLLVLKIIVPVKNRNSMANSLCKMNITAEILFPGIEGFAKSLLQKHVMEY